MNWRLDRVGGSGWQGEIDGERERERDGRRGRKWKLGKEEEKGAAVWVKESVIERVPYMWAKRVFDHFMFQMVMTGL